MMCLAGDCNGSIKADVVVPTFWPKFSAESVESIHRASGLGPEGGHYSACFDTAAVCPLRGT